MSRKEEERKRIKDKRKAAKKTAAFIVVIFPFGAAQSTNLTPGIVLELGEPRTLPNPLPFRRNTAPAREKKLFLTVLQKNFFLVNST